jgi:Ca2+-transporting ATPase
VRNDLLASQHRAWFVEEAAAVAAQLEADLGAGLSGTVARQRLTVAGPNRLPEAPSPSWPSRLLSQFGQLLILLLVAAAVVSLALGDWVDAIAIAAIVLLNGLLGFYQEYRAEQALRALEAMGARRASVLRDGHETTIEAEDVVPGDLLLLAAGDTVAADARLIEGPGLRADEALLTGESTPVDKRTDAVSPQADLAERTSMVHQGTLIVAGRGKAVVTATGGKTEMGMIAASVSAQRRPATPLQQRLDALGRVLVGAAVALSAVVLITSLIRGLGFEEGFFTAVSLAVAAVPEGLPAATTIVLALAVQRMAARDALVRRLLAVETLGSVTVICADKTGTLTQNSMRVEEIWVNGSALRVPNAERIGKNLIERLLTIAVLCNDADRGADGVRGDPTEVALLELADSVSPELRMAPRSSRLAEVPFDTNRRRMTVVIEIGGAARLLTKGAPEAILTRSTRLAKPDGDVAIDEVTREKVLADADAMAERGLRVLALADGAQSSFPEERDLTLVGLVGMADPLRPEARAAVATALAAGIRVVMITGDHALTAKAIGSDVGLPSTRIVTGRELTARSEADLAHLAQDTNVFARVTSEHKLQIVRALRSHGEIVAMTGDGVNDAPALRAADIGIAMGEGGTDVARAASDLILADNNFDTIVAAIEEGRTVFANLRGLIHFLLTCNLAEVLVVFGLLVAVGATPLIPVQILFVNLLTDSLPALALGVEPAEPQFMRSGPRQSRSIFGRDSLAALLGIGSLIAAVTLAAYAWGQSAGEDELASSMTFATLVGSQLAASLAFRSQTQSVLGLAPNYWLYRAILASATALFAVFYVPLLRDAFETAPLSICEWGVVAGLSLVPFVVVEGAKVTGFARRISNDG